MKGRGLVPIAAAVVAATAVALGVGFAIAHGRSSASSTAQASGAGTVLDVVYTALDGSRTKTSVRLGEVRCIHLGETYTLSASSPEYADALTAIGGEGELAVFTLRFEGKVFVASDVPAFDETRRQQLRVAGGVNALRDSNTDVGPPLSHDTVVAGSLGCDRVDR